MAALRSGMALDGGGSCSPLGFCPPPEDARFPLTDFALDKTDFASSLNVMAMKAAGWLAIGLRRLFGSRSRGRMGILTYHRVSPMIQGFPPPTHNVTPDRFREHVTGLLNRGFAVWPLRELLRYNALGRPTPPRTIALTFDDGFQSVYTNALPVLREFHVPATVFVTTAYLGGMAPFPFDTWGLAHREALPPATYRPLTIEQCHEMVDSGLIDLGAHTHTHRDMRGRPDCFREDLQISVDFLRTKFGLTDVMFAFPYGAKHSGFAGSQMATAARLTGVNCGLTTECSLIDSGSDPFEWGRFNAFEWDTAATLVAKLDGWYTWAARVKQFLRRPSAQACAAQ
ncbi:MAG: polysaccharide deacetylase family protein [Thermoguttaceae bacterium]